MTIADLIEHLEEIIEKFSYVAMTIEFELNELKAKIAKSNKPYTYIFDVGPLEISNLTNSGLNCSLEEFNQLLKRVTKKTPAKNLALAPPFNCDSHYRVLSRIISLAEIQVADLKFIMSHIKYADLKNGLFGLRISQKQLNVANAIAFHDDMAAINLAEALNKGISLNGISNIFELELVKKEELVSQQIEASMIQGTKSIWGDITPYAQERIDLLFNKNTFKTNQDLTIIREMLFKQIAYYTPISYLENGMNTIQDAYAIERTNTGKKLIKQQHQTRKYFIYD